MNPFKNILVPIDFGDASQKATALALGMARRFEARLTLLHVVTMPPYYYSAYAEGLAFPIDEMETRARMMLDETLKKARAEYTRCEGLIVAGQPWEQILEVARTKKMDLVVMGTHGRRGLSRVVLGSVAEKIVRHAPIPVLTTPGHLEEK